MARNLDPQIMSDPWFIDLDDRARLGWLMLILNGADDQGRFLLNGRLMKSMLFPADDLPASEVLAMLEAFAKAGKIHAYEKDGVRYGQIVKWWKYQIGSEWMAPSRHPAPDGWMDRYRVHAKGGKGIIETSPHWNEKQKCGFILQAGSSGSPLPELPKDDLGQSPVVLLPESLPSGDVKVKEEDKDKEEGKVDDEAETSSSPAVSSPNPFVSYEQNIGPLTSAVSERIQLAEKDYSTPWVVEAINLAAMRNKRRWDYVEGILRNWQKDGKDDGSPLEKSYAQELIDAGYTLPEKVPMTWLS